MKKYTAAVLALGMVFPIPVSAKYIDTRDITPEIKQVQRLLGSKRNEFGSEGAKAASAAVLAMGAGLAFAGAAHGGYYSYRTYYRPSYHYGYGNPYGYRNPYRSSYVEVRHGINPMAAVGGAMLMAGAVSAIAASAAEDEAAENNATIEQKITDIISGLVRTDEDYIKEAQTLNLRLSNEGETLIVRIDKRAQEALAALNAPSNRMETLFQAALEALPTRVTVDQYQKSLNRVSNQILGLESAPRPVKEIKADAKVLSKALKSAKKMLAKEIKELQKQAAKERKMYAKTTKSRTEAVIAERQASYDLFTAQATKQIDNLFQNYYQAYYAKVM